MAEDLGKLSPEQIKKLAGVISDAKGLTNQQAEIIERVLTGETDIGKLRISYLKEYFDLYSRNLDIIARKQSALNDALLIIDKQLTESYKKAQSINISPVMFKESSEVAKQSSDEATQTKGKKSKKAKEKNSKSDENTKSTKSGDDGGQQPPNTNTTGGKQPPAGNKKDVQNYNLIPDEKLAELESMLDSDKGDSDGKRKADQLKKFFQKTEEERRNIILSEQSYLKAIEDRRQEEKIKQLVDHAAKIKNIEESIMDLEIKRHKTEGDWQNQITELRLSRVQDSLKAEDEAQTLINKITAELTYASGENFVRDLNFEQENIETSSAKKTKNKNNDHYEESHTQAKNKGIESLTEARNKTKNREDDTYKESQKQSKREPEVAEIIEAKFITDDLTQKFKQLIPEDERSKDTLVEQQSPMGAEVASDEVGLRNAPLIENELLQYKQNNPEVASTLETKAKEADISKPAFIGDNVIQYVQNNTEEFKENSQEASKGDTTKIITIDTDLPMLGKNGQEITEAGEVRARKVEAKNKLKEAQAFEDSINKYRSKKELEAKRKNNGILSKEDASRIEKEIAKKFTLEKLYDKKRLEDRAKLEMEQARKAERENVEKNVKRLTEKGNSFAERKQAWQELTKDDSGDTDVAKAISATLVTISDLATQLEKKIDDIAKYKGVVDTRLQGSSNETKSGSYWNQLVDDMTGVAAVTPFFKQETFAANIEKLVEKGIAFDLKQRAFLMTIQNKIANTFDVADGTLLRLIRIQQEDSTAGRLGMESALNTFLNNMYETSEYLSQVADSVRGSLEEMQSLMTGAEAAEVEFQVQKWLGSLYSVGMSQSAVQGISDALGQIAAGQIEGLTSGGASNLLIMAANDAGLSIADILTKGIDSTDTNKLLQSAVNYLAELSNSAKDNKIIQQQLADVFGVKASDLRAATNLATASSMGAVYNSNMSYSGMLEQLMSMADTMGNRTSLAEMMTNLWENMQYSVAGSMASNPISYFIYKVAKVVDDAAGGIDLPFVNVLGSGVDLNTTVSDLMRVAAIGTGLLGSLGPLISGLGNSFDGTTMLENLGISTGSNLAITPRGTSGLFMTGSTGEAVSSSGYVGNAISGSEVKDATIQESKDTKKQLMIEAKEEAEADQLDILNTTVLQIYELLDDVTNGDKSFRVKVESYGLTNAGSGVNSLGAMGGVAGLGNSSSSGSTSSSGDSGGGNRASGVNSGGVGGSIDLGGWTMI